LIGGILPGLIVIQSAREASIMRVLGTSKKRTRIMLILEQLILCLFGMIVALILLAALNGTAILNIAEPLGLYCALHIAGCAAGVAVCSIVITRRRILELLQVKE
jgi:ABC-type antimicrobial peptide transport system permease subunit